ncbi:hypothetical protein GF345_04725 [Candidatus Woesearchaeota archaeon]|nr:hypothetical protein [Candidatus Woesearchaeota archaeon]
MKEMPLSDDLLDEFTRKNNQRIYHPKLMPCPLYDAAANLFQAHTPSDMSTSFFSSPEKLKIDGQGRILLPSKKEYDSIASGYINFVGVGPTIDLISEQSG